MRIILYIILGYLAYRLIKSWLRKSGASSAQQSFSESESRWASYSGVGEKDVTRRSKVLDD